MDDLTGRQFGAYRVVSFLGRGGMATVHKAYQSAVDRHVALKVLSDQFSADPQFLGRFRHEARIVAQLQHPRVLQVFDFGESDGYAFLAMPLVTGGTLAALMNRSPLDLQTIVALVAQICDALDYAHSKGIVHRDVKPSNILMDERGNCLVADFGLARLASASVRFTVSGDVMGTPAYMSPEQAAGKPVGPAGDIYSLGIVLYEMLTGRVPFVGDTPVAVAAQHLAATLPLPTLLNPSIPTSIEAVVMKALERAPERRYESAHALRVALSAAATEPPSYTSTSDAFDLDWKRKAALPTGHWRSPVKSSRRPITIALAIVALIAVVGASWMSLALRNRPSGRPESPQRTPSSDDRRPARDTAQPIVQGQPHDASVGRLAPGPSSIPAAQASPAGPARGGNDLSPRPPAPPAVSRASNSVAATRPPVAQIVVNALPHSQVYLDDVYRGAANAQGRLVLETTAESHTLKVSLAGRQDVTNRVTVVAGRALSVHTDQIESPARLRIHTLAGAEVILDNLSRGVVGLDGVMRLSDLASGQHEVRVLAPGKKPFRQSVTIGAGQEVIIDARLDDLRF